MNNNSKNMKVLRKEFDAIKITKNSYRINYFILEKISLSKNINQKLFHYDNKKNIDKTLYSIISKKFFFKKYNASPPDLSDNYKFKHELKKDEYYTPKENIVFNEKKYLLVDCNKNFSNSIQSFQRFVIYPILGISTIFLIKSIIKLKVISILLSSFFTYTSYRLNIGINQNKRHIINKLYLLDNGKECEIHTLEQSFISKIKNIRRLELEEGLYVAINIKDMKKNYIPLVIETRLYLIPLISTIYDQKILSAISNGKFIKTDERINSEEAIDIN